MEGTIARMVKDKGFGFIKDSKGTEYFFHRSQLRNSQFENLKEGTEVTFEECEGQKGMRAEDIFV